MKKTLTLLAALALATAGTAFAQAPAVKTTGSDANQNAMHQNLAAKSGGKGGKMADKNPAQKADHKAAKMAKDLGLTADQEAKVEKLMVDHEQENTTLKAKYAADKTAGRPAMKAAHDRYEAQLKTILTPEQYAKLDKMKAEHHGHGKDKTKAKA
ncbi:hypothetical protein [Hymenobacter terricola]|uniref:hypothetical protein n=1 Tax=Hymenobacter terricola TaxID=2819236 RepID=UPI001B302510|nr:hypothetical protein [Hymenobacter terricola]